MSSVCVWRRHFSRFATKVRQLSCEHPQTFHVPVMKDEIVRFFDPKPSQVLLDMTFGAGGHTRALLQQVPDLTCFCLDRDPEFVVHADRLMREYGKTENSFTTMSGKFSDLPHLCEKHGLKPCSIDMIVMDLGVSSMQLDDRTRGFAFKSDCALDMRMDGLNSNALTAADVINNLDAPNLAQIFKLYGDVRFARRIANAILEHRQTLGPIKSTKQLAEVVASLVPMRTSALVEKYKQTKYKIHPATQVFQALRIFVNDELNELCVGLEMAHRLLKQSHPSSDAPGGRVAIISFHSLEDRLVKWALTERSDNSHVGLAFQLANRSVPNVAALQRRRHLLRELDPTQHASGPTEGVQRWKHTIGPLLPTPREIAENPRSRSAKLRAGEKI